MSSMLRELLREEVRVELLGEVRKHVTSRAEVRITVPITIAAPNVVTHEPGEWAKLSEHELHLESLDLPGKTARAVLEGNHEFLKLVAIDGNTFDDNDSERVLTALLRRNDIRKSIAKIVAGST